MATIKSIEEKAKAYDEAIEKLCRLHDDYDTVSTLIDIKKELENIFPELAESEDDRIRKALVELVHDTTSDSLWVDYNVHKEDALAWLEKQGKQILVNSAKTCKDGQKSADAEKGAKWNEGENPNSVWSEDDEEEFKIAIDTLVEAGQRDSAHWLKSLKDRVQPQPKQEWSEEDRKIIIELIGIFESAVDGGHVAFPYRLIKDYIKVLKSCLPQTTWKPSDEQMKALDRAQAELCSTEYNKPICDLIDILNKLRGE